MCCVWKAKGGKINQLLKQVKVSTNWDIYYLLLVFH